MCLGFKKFKSKIDQQTDLLHAPLNQSIHRLFTSHNSFSHITLASTSFVSFIQRHIDIGTIANRICARIDQVGAHYNPHSALTMVGLAEQQSEAQSRIARLLAVRSESNTNAALTRQAYSVQRHAEIDEQRQNEALLKQRHRIAQQEADAYRAQRQLQLQRQVIASHEDAAVYQQSRLLMQQARQQRANTASLARRSASALAQAKRHIIDDSLPAARARQAAFAQKWRSTATEQSNAFAKRLRRAQRERELSRPKEWRRLFVTEADLHSKADDVASPVRDSSFAHENRVIHLSPDGHAQLRSPQQKREQMNLAQQAANVIRTRATERRMHSHPKQQQRQQQEEEEMVRADLSSLDDSHIEDVESQPMESNRPSAHSLTPQAPDESLAKTVRKPPIKSPIKVQLNNQSNLSPQNKSEWPRHRTAIDASPVIQSVELNASIRASGVPARNHVARSIPVHHLVPEDADVVESEAVTAQSLADRYHAEIIEAEEAHLQQLFAASFPLLDENDEQFADSHRAQIEESTLAASIASSTGEQRSLKPQFASVKLQPVDVAKTVASFKHAEQAEMQAVESLEQLMHRLTNRVQTQSDTVTEDDATHQPAEDDYERQKAELLSSLSPVSVASTHSVIKTHRSAAVDAATSPIHVLQAQFVSPRSSPAFARNTVDHFAVLDLTAQQQTVSSVNGSIQPQTQPQLRRMSSMSRGTHSTSSFSESARQSHLTSSASESDDPQQPQPSVQRPTSMFASVQKTPPAARVASNYQTQHQSRQTQPVKQQQQPPRSASVKSKSKSPPQQHSRSASVSASSFDSRTDDTASQSSVLTDELLESVSPPRLRSALKSASSNRSAHTSSLDDLTDADNASPRTQDALRTPEFTRDEEWAAQRLYRAARSALRSEHRQQHQQQQQSVPLMSSAQSVKSYASLNSESSQSVNRSLTGSFVSSEEDEIDYRHAQSLRRQAVHSDATQSSSVDTNELLDRADHVAQTMSDSNDDDDDSDFATALSLSEANESARKSTQTPKKMHNDIQHMSSPLQRYVDRQKLKIQSLKHEIDANELQDNQRHVLSPGKMAALRSKSISKSPRTPGSFASSLHRSASRVRVRASSLSSKAKSSKAKPNTKSIQSQSKANSSTKAKAKPKIKPAWQDVVPAPSATAPHETRQRNNYADQPSISPISREASPSVSASLPSSSVAQMSPQNRRLAHARTSSRLAAGVDDASLVAVEQQKSQHAKSMQNIYEHMMAEYAGHIRDVKHEPNRHRAKSSSISGSHVSILSSPQQTQRQDALQQEQQQQQVQPIEEVTEQTDATQSPLRRQSPAAFDIGFSPVDKSRNHSAAPEQPSSATPLHHRLPSGALQRSFALKRASISARHERIRHLRSSQQHAAAHLRRQESLDRQQRNEKQRERRLQQAAVRPVAAAAVHRSAASGPSTSRSIHTHRPDPPRTRRSFAPLLEEEKARLLHAQIQSDQFAFKQDAKTYDQLIRQRNARMVQQANQARKAHQKEHQRHEYQRRQSQQMQTRQDNWK